MNTPPRKQESVGQPISAGFQTPPRPERPEFIEPPPRPTKKRRAIDVAPIINLGALFEKVSEEQ